MKIVLSYISTRAPKGCERALFCGNGDTIPLPNPSFDLKGNRDVIVELTEGLYWFFQASNGWVSVRYFTLTDQYPLGTKETLETALVTNILCEGYDVSTLRVYLEGEMSSTDKKELRYPKALIDAICNVVERANTE